MPSQPEQSAFGEDAYPTVPMESVCDYLIAGAGGGNRTHTGGEPHRVSPRCYGASSAARRRATGLVESPMGTATGWGVISWAREGRRVA
jgi:hypothetical protein